MAKKKTEISGNQLVNNVIEAIKEKKGEDILLMDFSELKTNVCDYFIICHGNSNTHVGTIADEIQRHIYKTMKETPHHVEGLQNAEWVLLDYFDTVVHVFQEDKRNFYQIEALWADAKIKKIKN